LHAALSRRREQNHEGDTLTLKDKEKHEKLKLTGRERNKAQNEIGTECQIDTGWTGDFSIPKYLKRKIRLLPGDNYARLFPRIRQLRVWRQELCSRTSLLAFFLVIRESKAQSLLIR